MDEEKNPQTINEEAGLPDNWVPVDAPPIIPGSSLADGSSKYLQGSLPPQSQHDVSFAGTAYKSDRTPSLALMPLGVQGNPSSNAAVQSTSAQVSQQQIAAIPPVPTADVDTGDGLIHGDSVWLADSAYVSWRDDFKFGSATVATGGGSTIGELKWDGVSGSGAAVDHVDGQWPHTGVLNFKSGTSTATYSSIFFPWASSGAPGGNASGGMPLLDYPGWKMVWVFGFPQERTTAIVSPFPLAKKQFYCGLAVASGSNPNWNLGGTVNARPPYFIGLRFDTDATAPAISDSTLKFEVVANPNFGPNRINTQGTVVDTGMTPTEFRWYRFEITCTAAGSVTMYLTDGVTSITQVFSNIVKYTSLGNVGSSVYSLTRGNGLGEINQVAQATATTSNFAYAIGSIVTISGSSQSFYNSTFTLLSIPGVAAGATFILAGGANTAAGDAITISGYPSLTPYFAWGNDSQATPITTQIGVDFFALVWNSGLAATPLALSNTNPRWMAGV